MSKSHRSTLLVLLVLLMGMTRQFAHSQELTPVMEGFRTVCTQTRDAIGKRDRQALEECRVAVSNFYLNGIGHLNLTPVDTFTLHKEVPDSLLCALLDLKYIDDLLANDIDFSRVKHVGHSSNRGTADTVPSPYQSKPASGCFICHKGIPAGATMSYKASRCSKNMRLVVVVAEKEDINLTVTSLIDGGGDNPVEKSVEPSGMGLLVHTWKMPSYKSDIVLTFENPNKTGVTCVIALQ